jgi:hypothetical protein
LQKQRGCKKPGANFEGEMVFRFTSQRLSPTDQILRECPVGKVLSDAPWAYDAIYAETLAEHSGLQVLEQPKWLQSTIHVVASERARLREMAEKDRQLSRDAEYGKRLVRGA